MICLCVYFAVAVSYVLRLMMYFFLRGCFCVVVLFFMTCMCQVPWRASLCVAASMLMSFWHVCVVVSVWPCLLTCLCCCFCFVVFPDVFVLLFQCGRVSWRVCVAVSVWPCFLTCLCCCFSCVVFHDVFVLLFQCGRVSWCVCGRCFSCVVSPDVFVLLFQFCRVSWRACVAVSVWSYFMTCLFCCFTHVFRDVFVLLFQCGRISWRVCVAVSVLSCFPDVFVLLFQFCHVSWRVCVAVAVSSFSVTYFCLCVCCSAFYYTPEGAIYHYSCFKQTKWRCYPSDVIQWRHSGFKPPLYSNLWCH